MKTNPQFQGTLVIYGLGLVFGLGCIFWAITALRTGRASARWPTIQGEIIESQSSRAPTDGRPRQRDSDRALIAYRYYVNDTQYTSRQISLWSPDLSLASGMVQPFVAAHPVESVVDVHYEPAHPENAVLIPGANEKLDWLLVSAGGICLLASGSGFAGQRRHRRLLLSLPDAAAIRGGLVTRAGYERAKKAFGLNLSAAGFLGMMVLLCLLPPLLGGPGGLPGAIKLQPQWLVPGILACLAAVYFLRRGMVKGRSLECPVCRNLFRKYTLETGRCEVCGAQAFSDMAPAPDSVVEKLRQESEVWKSRRRLIDSGGLAAVHLAMLGLLALTDRGFTSAALVLALPVFGLDVCYLFMPPKRRPILDSKSALEVQAQGAGFESFALDYFLLCAPPVVLTSLFLALIWSHQTLARAELITIIIAIPIAVGLVSWAGYSRSTRRGPKVRNKSTKFLALAMLATWMGSAFLFVVLVVCLLLR